MYFHYVRHGLKPSEYYSMGPGEQAIINAFMEKELEDEAAERKKIEDIMKTNKKSKI